MADIHEASSNQDEGATARDDSRSSWQHSAWRGLSAHAVSQGQETSGLVGRSRMGRTGDGPGATTFINLNPLKSLFAPLVQTPMPVWAGRITLLSGKFDNRLPRLFAAAERSDNKALVALLDNFNLDRLLRHWGENDLMMPPFRYEAGGKLSGDAAADWTAADTEKSTAGAP